MADQGKHKEAIAELDRCIGYNAKYAPAYNNRGASKFKLEYYREAVKDFTEALKIDPNYTNAYVNRGVAREMSRDQSGACSDWKKSSEMGSELGRKYFINNCSE